MTEKPCRDCRATKPLSDFYARADTRDGRHVYCKDCHRARNAKWCADNPDRMRHLRLSRYWKKRDECVEKGRRDGEARGWRTNPTPESKAAKDAVYRAVKAGRIVRPTVCPVCGRSDVPVQAHHDDYSRRLDVRWMCKWCHEAEHHGTSEYHPSVTVGGESKPG